MTNSNYSTVGYQQRAAREEMRGLGYECHEEPVRAACGHRVTILHGVSRLCRSCEMAAALRQTKKAEAHRLFRPGGGDDACPASGQGGSRA